MMSSREWLLSVLYRNGTSKQILFNSITACLEYVNSIDYTYIKHFSITNSIYWVN